MNTAQKPTLKKFHIGGVQLRTPVISSPMAGVTNLAYRRLAREMGAGLVVTEMVSDHALRSGSEATRNIMRLDPDEHPVSIQIFGGSPVTMSEAARIVEQQGPDIIDINMGCPAPKICKGGGGSALLREPLLAARIIESVVQAVSCPVTVKMRIGWDENSVNIEQMARIAEESGAAAITIHGRTRLQGYSGHADWGAIARAVQVVKIPVIGNGDVWQPQDAGKLLEQTGCAGIAMARGTMGNPWLFRRVVHYLETGEVLPEPSAAERAAVALRHLHMLVELKGVYLGVREMRKHASWYTRGLPGGALVRNLVNQAETVEEMERAIRLVADSDWIAASMARQPGGAADEEVALPEETCPV